MKFKTLFASLLMATAAFAQTFPQNKAITLVVPFTAGGGTDAIARAVAEELRETLNTTVIVENKGGAGGAVASNFVSKAEPDGHTLMLVTSTIVTNAAVTPNLPYDVLKDFTHVALMGTGPLVVVVNKEAGIASMVDLIAQLKKGKEFIYVSSGIGSVLHLSGEAFLQSTKTKMLHVPYRGSAQAVTDLLAGRGQVAFTTLPTILGQIQGNSVNLIAVTTKERSKLYPDIPTMQESGVKDYDVGTWWGILAPPKLPAEILAKLNDAINKATSKESITKRFDQEGAVGFKGAPKALYDITERDLIKWKQVVADGNIKPN